ncbi:GNAT family N-acetyltransferase [Streptomyces sp. HNM0574]|uniref:GNAT family N-acetyltransferase n=1 Tax=Streptomyces sp. HNM0574 TaxID=2714954 RepID=UPI00146E1714|nr:GNAT family N-acetyltransferase [Streptomyces sp. HNM0574]NLU67585.1 N-acetyltransferase [Streptomyces sp. HNM0574]
MTRYPDVVDVPEESRYEARYGGAVAGVAEYLRTGELIAFVHTEVDPHYEGQGVGSALARNSLDAARTAGLAVLPVCPFYASWIGKHPEYQDLLYSKKSRVTD